MDEIKGLFFTIICAILIIALVTISENKHNTKVHSDDVTVTEWVSPDGVHYWYQKNTYQAMLAPRYDKNGNLVIDK